MKGNGNQRTQTTEHENTRGLPGNQPASLLALATGSSQQRSCTIPPSSLRASFWEYPTRRRLSVTLLQVRKQGQSNATFVCLVCINDRTFWTIAPALCLLLDYWCHRRFPPKHAPTALCPSTGGIVSLTLHRHNTKYHSQDSVRPSNSRLHHLAFQEQYLAC